MTNRKYCSHLAIKDLASLRMSVLEFTQGFYDYLCIFSQFLKKKIIQRCHLLDKLVWANLGDTRHSTGQNQEQQSSQHLPKTTCQVSAHTFKLSSYKNICHMFKSKGVIIPQHVMQQRTSCWFFVLPSSTYVLSFTGKLRGYCDRLQAFLKLSTYCLQSLSIKFCTCSQNHSVYCL